MTKEEQVWSLIYGKPKKQERKEQIAEVKVLPKQELRMTKKEEQVNECLAHGNTAKAIKLSREFSISPARFGKLVRHNLRVERGKDFVTTYLGDKIIRNELVGTHMARIKG